MKNIIRVLRNGLYRIFNFFYLPYTYNSFLKQIKQLTKETQLFFVTRTDLGANLLTISYAKCWEKKRSKVCLIILTTEFSLQEATTLFFTKLQVISPNLLLLTFAKLFGRRHVHLHTLREVYAKLTIDFPQATVLFETITNPKIGVSHSRYIAVLDQNIVHATTASNKSFLDAYTKVREIIDVHPIAHKDMITLYQSTLRSTLITPSESKVSSLKKQLNIRKPYALLNINCKNYPLQMANRRTIRYPERYNCIIDDLIHKGYQVILQGRSEQPHFPKRDNFIDYAHSNHCSVENDLLLFSACTLAIMSKTGPEIYGMLCDTPILGLNYTELASFNPSKKLRFFPKHIKREGTRLSWQQFLSSPCFFSIGSYDFETKITYEELDESELLIALQEFLTLLSHPSSTWDNYSNEQKSFIDCLTPLHLDLFETKGCPLNSYLQYTSSCALKKP